MTSSWRHELLEWRNKIWNVSLIGLPDVSAFLKKFSFLKMRYGAKLIQPWNNNTAIDQSTYQLTRLIFLVNRTGGSPRLRLNHLGQTLLGIPRFFVVSGGFFWRFLFIYELLFLWKSSENGNFRSKIVFFQGQVQGGRVHYGWNGPNDWKWTVWYLNCRPKEQNWKACRSWQS